jgi:hypothetical protein
MAGFSRSWIVFATMLVAAALLFSRGESGVAYAQSAPTSCSTSTPTPTSTPTLTAREGDGGRASAAYVAAPPCPTGADSSAGSINDVA